MLLFWGLVQPGAKKLVEQELKVGVDMVKCSWQWLIVLIVFVSMK